MNETAYSEARGRILDEHYQDLFNGGYRGARDIAWWEAKARQIWQDAQSASPTTAKFVYPPTVTPDWIKSRALSMAPGECACGIKKEQCGYHGTKQNEVTT